MFRKADTDGDGELGLDEMKRAGVDTPTAHRVGDQLTYSEYLAATTDVTFNDGMLEDFFNRFDKGKLFQSAVSGKSTELNLHHCHHLCVCLLMCVM